MNKFFFVMFICLFASVGFAKNGYYPTQFQTLNKSSAPSANVLASTLPALKNVNLQYYGGPVISAVNVYVVHWGPNVNQETKDNVDTFYKAVLNSTYMDWLDIYNTYTDSVSGTKGTQQHIGRGKFIETITITPKNTAVTLTDQQIQDELQGQIDGGKLPKPDDNTLYMVYFAKGFKITNDGATSCKEFCAYHGFKGSPTTDHFYYGVMPDITGLCKIGCSPKGTHLDGVTSISSHELIEAVTDPYPTPGSTPAYPQAWNREDGYEISDICFLEAEPLKYGTKIFSVSSNWDNSIKACTNTTYTSP